MAAVDGQEGNVASASVNGAGAQTLRCPSCRSQVKPADEACPTCGYALHAAPTLEAAQTQEVAPPIAPAPQSPEQSVIPAASPSAPSQTASAAVTKPELPKTRPVKHITVPITAKPKPAQPKAASKQVEPKSAPRAVRRRAIPPIIGFTVVFVSTIGGVLLLTAAVRNLVPGDAVVQSAAATGPSLMATATAPSARTSTTTPAAATSAAPNPNGLYDVEMVTARYEITGRPAKGCGLPDATNPVRKFTFTLAITNKTGADTDAAKWGTAAFTRNGRAFQVCYFNTEGPSVPGLPKNRTQRVTLSAFVERNESVTAIMVGDNAGNAQRICVRGTQRIKCQ